MKPLKILETGDSEMMSPSRLQSPLKFRKDKRKWLTDADVLSDPQEIKILEKTMRNEKEKMINQLFSTQKECVENCFCSVCQYKRIHEFNLSTMKGNTTAKDYIDVGVQRRVYFYDGEMVQLFISCRNLVDLDGKYDKSDPYVVLETRTQQDGEWEKNGQTETIFDNLNPNYSKCLSVQYNQNEVLYLRFSVYDYDGNIKTKKHDDYIGQVECTLTNILIDDSDQIVIFDLLNGVDIQGKIIIKAERENSLNKKDMMNKGEHLRQVQKAEESDFGFILRNLKFPSRIKQGLHLNVPATLFFQQGNCKMLAYTHAKEKSLKFQEFTFKKVNFTEIRKEMMDIRNQYEQNKQDIKYGHKKFEKHEHRKNLLQGPNAIPGLPGLPGLQKFQGLQLIAASNNSGGFKSAQSKSKGFESYRKKDMISSAPLLECKECKQQYYSDAKSCKWLCDTCREYYYRHVDTSCSCKEEGGCRLKVVYKKEDLKESVIVKQQIISPQTETDHPAFFSFSKENKHDMIELYSQNSIQIQKFEEFPSEQPRQYIACLQPELGNQKKIKLEFKMSTFKTARTVGLGICYSTINQKKDYLFQKKAYGSNDAFLIFADSSISPVNMNQKNAQKKAFPIRQGDLITMLFNPQESSIQYFNKRTQQEFKRDDIIFKDGVSFVPCVTLSDKNDLLELVSSVEVSEVSLQTFKKQEQISIANEIEFQNMMLKRPFHPMWKQIQFIQNYIKLDKDSIYMKQYTFEYEFENNSELFKRALIDIQIINQEICKANSLYVDREKEYGFEQQLMHEDRDQYARYMVYKIVNFVETFHKYRIVKMRTYWLKDEVNHMYFVNVSHLQSRHSERQYQTQEQFLKKKSDQASKQLQEIQKLKQKYKHLNNSDNVKKFRSQLLSFYEGKKMQFGIDLNFDPKQEYKESDQVFKQIYPQSHFELSTELNKLEQDQQLGVKMVKEKIAQHYWEEYKKKEVQLSYINLEAEQNDQLQQQQELQKQQSGDERSLGFSLLQEQKQLEKCLEDLEKMSITYAKNKNKKRSVTQSQNQSRNQFYQKQNSQKNPSILQRHSNNNNDSQVRKNRSVTYKEGNQFSRSGSKNYNNEEEREKENHNFQDRSFNNVSENGSSQIQRPWTNINMPRGSNKSSENGRFRNTVRNNFTNINNQMNYQMNRNPNYSFRAKTGINANIYFLQKNKKSLPFLIYSDNNK